LLGFALGLSDVEIATHEREPVGEAGAQQWELLLQRRLTGESVARIIGEREFYGLAFGLNAATLEPRPETEMLVDLAIASLPKGGRLLDLGTGSGAIAIAVLVNRSDASAVATDLSAVALQAARGNAERHGIERRISLLPGNWFEPVEAEFNLIISNPPYITSAIVDTLSPEVRDFDPRLALDGGPDGLAPYRVIAAQAAQYLVPGGQVLVEIGYDQGAAVMALFVEAGFGDVMVYRDLAGLDRVTSAHHVFGTTRTGR